MYPTITHHHVKTEGESHVSRLPSRPLRPLSITVESMHASCLKCCGVVQREPGVADAMIEAFQSIGGKRRSRIRMLF